MPPATEKNKAAELFTFDHVLVANSQERMYRYAAKETVTQFTKGYHGTIFAYGQSGSGKTYTMLGPEEVVELIKSGQEISEDIQNLYGIIPRAIRDFFEYMNTAIEQEGAQFQLGINYFEIYKESLNNLLGASNVTSQNLKISNNKVLNANPLTIQTPEQIFYYIQMGQNKVQM